VTRLSFKRLSTPLLLDDELVLDAKRSGTHARACGDRLVALVVHHARERDRPLHDDVQGVVAERLMPETGWGSCVKAGAEPMPVAPQHPRGAYRDRNGSR